MKKAKPLVAAETNLIRRFMEQNLELGKSHEDIIQQLGISQATYYRHVKRIMDTDAKLWDSVHMDSAKYRAQRLVDSLLNCVNLCKQLMNDEKARPDDRIEAAKTLCIAETNIFKIVNEGPVFRVSLPVFPNNHQQELTDKDTKQLPK
jgi:hypothetical protein